MASSIVAVLQLVMAAAIWGYSVHVVETGLVESVVATIVSLSGGVVLANFFSLILVMVEVVILRR